MKSHGNANVGQLPGVKGAELPLLWRAVEDGEPLLDHNQAAQAGNHLTDHRGNGSAGNPHGEHQNQHQVQHDVHQRSNHQEVHRGFAVPQGTEDAACHVVQHGGRNTVEDDLNVADRIVHNFRRGVHPAEHGRAQEPCGNCQHNAEGGGQVGGVHYEAPHVTFFLGTEGLGNGDGKARTNAHAEAQDQEVDGAGGAYGSQCVGTKELAYNGCIHNVIQLLENETEKQRRGKAKHQLHGRPFSQVADGGARHQSHLKSFCAPAQCQLVIS